MNALIKQKGIKKAHICRELGRSTYYLRDAEKTNIDICGDSLDIIARILGTTPEYLTGITDDPYAKSHTHEIIPHEAFREVLANDGVRVLLDASSKLSESDLREIVDFIKFKQAQNDRK